MDAGICRRGLFPPHAALCHQPGRSTEQLLAEASGQIEKQPHAGTFYMSICYKLCSSLARFGNEPPSLEVFLCSQAETGSYPSLMCSGMGMGLAGGKGLPVCGLCVCVAGDIFGSELNLEMKRSEYGVWFGKENVKMRYRCLCLLWAGTNCCKKPSQGLSPFK